MPHRPFTAALNLLSGPWVSVSATLSGCRTPQLAVAVVLGLSSRGAAQDRGIGDQTDKIMHATASALIVDAVWLSAALLDQPIAVRAGVGVGVAAAAGVAKEGVDAFGFGTPDVADLVFDAFGIAIGVAIALVVETLAADADTNVDKVQAELAGGDGR